MKKQLPDLSPAFLNLLAKRGLKNDADIASFLFSGLEALHDPFLMKHMVEVKARIERAVHAGEKILIHGDYDVDGVTSVAILARTLEKLGVSYPLLSDPDHGFIEACGFWAAKKMYGKEYMGVERSTVIADPGGKAVKIFRKVKVSGHAEEVLQTLKEHAG
ncbi:MAG: hypothetical protein EOM65_10760 [Synergistales bacterium]|nr:hypothetical protein [Synergistales bacterium]